MNGPARHRDILRIRQVHEGADAVAHERDLDRRAAGLIGVDTALREADDRLARKRAVMARYASSIRYRQEREAERLGRAFMNDMAAREQDSRRVLEAERVAVVAGAYRAALGMARADMAALVETSLRRIVGDMAAPAQVTAALDTALAEIAARRNPVIRVNPARAEAVESLMAARIGARWQSMIALEYDPGLADDGVEVTTRDGVTVLTPLAQVDRLARSMAGALRVPADGKADRDPSS